MRVDGRTRDTCATCDKNGKKRIEHVVMEAIKGSIHHPWSAIDQKGQSVRVANCKTLGDCSFRRPDCVWLGADRVVHLEVDENSHADREVSCELTKVDDTAWGVGEYSS